METGNTKNHDKHITTVKAVLFDWGGVLIDDPTPGITASVKARLGLPAAAEFQLSEDTMKAFQKGEITELRFWELVSDAFPGGNTGEPGLWREAFESTYREKSQVFAWIERLRAASIRTGALSNTEAPSVEMLFAKGYTCFDHLLFSCECGLVKPEPEIFRYALDKVALKPGEVFFIDDKQLNVDAARGVGIHAHRFVSEAALFAAAAELGLPV